MNLNYIDFGGIPIGIYNDGPIGVSISGGADSALLLYMLMSNVTQPIHIYNMWSSSRKFSFAKSIDNVIAVCSKLTGNVNYTVHKVQVEPKESIEFCVNMLSNALNKDIDIIYLGLTKFPPKQVYLQFEQQQQDWHNEFRSDEIVHPLFGLTINEGPDTSSSLDNRAYVPLFNYNKKDIARLYKLFDLENTLLPVTRSCEDDDHPDSHCGKCWWCQERLWAFGHLGE
jgi:hypothetical protein